MREWLRSKQQDVWLAVKRQGRGRIRLHPNPLWFGDADGAALIDARSGRVFGTFQHDGYGKWDVVLYVSYVRALRLVFTQPASFISLAAFPTCALRVFRSKSPSGAAKQIEYLSGAAWLEEL